MTTTTTNFYIFAFFAVVVMVAFGQIFFTVKQQTAEVIERFEEFVRIAKPGLQIKIPFIEKVAGIVNLRVKQLDVKIETKTLDDVFVLVTVSVQYYAREDRIFEAFYRLQDPERQINSFVFDVVRARVPSIKLDDVFRKKDEIADAVKAELEHTMGEFGYGIVKSLVTDIEPDAKVKAAMNEINAAQRMRLAAAEKGEAERILRVKNAEASAQSKALQGKGIADERAAIVLGLKDSINEFQHEVPGATAKDVMTLVLLTQYFDTLAELAQKGPNTILIPHSPGALTDIAEQIRNAVIIGGQVPDLESKPKSLFEGAVPPVRNDENH